MLIRLLIRVLMTRAIAYLEQVRSGLHEMQAHKKGGQPLTRDRLA